MMFIFFYYQGILMSTHANSPRHTRTVSLTLRNKNIKLNTETVTNSNRNNYLLTSKFNSTLLVSITQMGLLLTSTFGSLPAENTY